MRIKNIPNFEGYKITDKGLVIGKRFGKPMKPRICRNGYKTIFLRKDGKYYGKRICRLVLEAFIGECPKNKECNHINGDRLDDNVENLEWITHSKNLSHSFKIGNRCHKGQNHPMSKLTNNQVRLIKETHGLKLISPRLLSHIFDITRAYVYDLQNNRRWGHL